MTASSFPDKVIGLTPTETARASQKARIHNGAIGDKQPGSSTPENDPRAAQGRCKDLENRNN
jgi:hypothetical protein